ncbi:hypothetical protein OG401_23810 [Kitasatospora purpeofusca]|uniref:P22 phage major capsid protein family protein n=1 Tax=Kitasatospora purpeofusca TaxID=67352 RepID=UPI00225770ED|nr:P22 phage major capsid protein family protein [Kitasatospora purpeofusca]MCX4687290.1 hypothetical protein [Kitasatospora purpeofusca]
MADHSFNLAKVYAQAALPLLTEQLVLGRLVFRDAEREFSGGVGTVVNIRKPGALSARETTLKNNSPITTDTVSEGTIPVQIDKHIYSAVDLTEEDTNLNVENFAAQILDPQVQAVADKIEANLAVEINKQSALAGAVSVSKANPANAYSALVDVANIMDKGKISRSGRMLVVSPDFLTLMLKDPNLTRVDASGESGALRDAYVNQLLGFKIYMSNQVNGAVAFTREAFSLVVRAPRKPEGVAFAASADGNGYALRVLRDYNTSTLTDRSIVSTLMGVTTLDTNRAVGLKLIA